MPNNKMPEENADDSIIFIAASDEIFFSRSKLAIAATGIVDNSNDKKNINRLPLEIIKNIPNNADNINMENSGMCSLFFNQSAHNNEMRYTLRFKIFFCMITSGLVRNMPSNN